MSNNGYKAVIYDCDGVMFDSFEANVAFYERIMALMGKPPLNRHSEEQMRVLHTFANREVLAWFFPEERDFTAAGGTRDERGVGAEIDEGPRRRRARRDGDANPCASRRASRSGGRRALRRRRRPRAP